MDDKTYIARLEKKLSERQSYINELVDIYSDLVSEKEELSDIADRLFSENIDLRMDKQKLCETLTDMTERFDDLIVDYHILDQEHSKIIADNEKKMKALKEALKERDDEIRYLNSIVDGASNK